MPPFFFADDDDDEEPEQGVPEDAVPALEALAANNGLRDQSLRRFEADEPPPYESSTEPEDFGGHDLLDPPPAPPIVHDTSIPNHGGVPHDVLQTLERPLSDEEMESIATAAHHLLSPAEVFYGDALREDQRMPFSESFRETVGLRRVGLVVRHVLKNHWRKLGVWNEAWGFAGRNVAPEDRYRDWRWPWEQQDPEDREAVEENRKQLVLRGLRSRQHLSRGEHVPGPPLAHLEPDSSIEEAESFLISRPWFIFRLERFEDTMRNNRLDQATRLQYKGRLGPSVKEHWQERGEWRQEFGLTPGFDIERVTSWKWQHESPSPEPEDLSCITKPLQPVSLRYYHDDLHFTPSEYDEIEVLERLLEDRPKNSWIVQDSDFDQPPIPGQVHREVEDRGPIFPSANSESTAAAGQTGRPGALVQMFGGGLFSQGQGIFGRALNTESTDEPENPESEESLEDAGEPEGLEDLEDLEEPPVSPPTGIVREQSGQSKQGDSATSPPAPRQSARTAAASRKRETEAPLPEPWPPKRARRTKAPAAPAAAAKAKAPSTGAKRGRPAGRPRKSLIPEPEPEPLPKTQKKEAPAKKAAETPARRGRPPKEQAPVAQVAKAGKKAAAAAPTKPAARRGRPSKSVTPAKLSVAVTKAKQRVTAKVIGKRGRPSAVKTQASAAEKKPAASVAKRSALSVAATPQDTPRRGRPSRAQAQGQPEEEKVPTTTATAAKRAKKNIKTAAPEEPVAPRRASRPARVAPAAPAAVPAKSKQTAPEEKVAATPNRRGCPAKAAAKTAPAVVTEEKTEETTPPKEENVTPGRGRSSKAQELEKKATANAAAAAAVSEKKNHPAVAPEEGHVPTARRGRPSKAANLAAATAKAENDKPSVSEEGVLTPRARGRPGKKAATTTTAAVVPVAAPVPEKKSKQPAAPEEAVDTPRRRGRPARQTAQSQEDEPTPAPTPVAAAPVVNGTSAAKKKVTATPNKKTAAVATPQRASNRVTKRTAVTNSSSKVKKVAPTASPATRGRGRPRKG